MLQNNNINVACVTEAWLDESTYDEDIDTAAALKILPIFTATVQQTQSRQRYL